MCKGKTNTCQFFFTFLFRAPPPYDDNVNHDNDDDGDDMQCLDKEGFKQLDQQMVGEHVDGKSCFKAYSREVSEENHENQHKKKNVKEDRHLNKENTPHKVSNQNFDMMNNT